MSERRIPYINIYIQGNVQQAHSFTRNLNVFIFVIAIPLHFIIHNFPIGRPILLVVGKI